MITAYISYLRLNRGFSEQTCRAYDISLRSFARYAFSCDNSVRWSTVTRCIVEGWVLSMVEQGLVPSTIKQRVSILRGFYREMIRRGANIVNPAQFVSTPKIGSRLPATVSRETIADALASDDVPAVAKAAIAILFETGLRASEICGLTASMVDKNTHSIRVVGKGNKERVVYYGPLTVEYGRYWPFAQVEQRQLRRMVYNALAPFAGGNFKLSPHVLRHTFASELLSNGMSLDSISTLLGHASLETTRIYAKLPTDALRRQYMSTLPAVA